MMREEASKIVNTPSRPSQELAFAEAQDFPSSDVYVALPQETSGVPALTKLGTGTDTNAQEGDQPGSARCDIYKVSILDEIAQLTLIGHDKEVFNLSTTALEQDWFTVHRTNFGSWMAVTGGVCASQNAILQIHNIGPAGGGTFSMDLNVLGVTDTLTFNYDSTAAQTKAEVETHTQVALDDVLVSGDMPFVSVEIEFQNNLADTHIAVPTNVDITNLVDGPGTGTPQTQRHRSNPCSHTERVS